MDKSTATIGKVKVMLSEYSQSINWAVVIMIKPIPLTDRALPEVELFQNQITSNI